MTAIRIFITIVLLAPGAHDASRYNEMEKVASSTENICVLKEKEGVWQYGLTLHYKIDGECDAEACNPLRVLCENIELITEAVDQDGKCLCEVNDKPVFEKDSENQKFEIEDRECTAAECWSSYLDLLQIKMDAAKKLAKDMKRNEIKFDRGAGFEEHWHAECKSVQSNNENGDETPNLIPTLTDVAEAVKYDEEATKEIIEQFGDDYQEVLFPREEDVLPDVRLVTKQSTPGHKAYKLVKQRSAEWKTVPSKKIDMPQNQPNTRTVVGKTDLKKKVEEEPCNEDKLLYSKKRYLEPKLEDDKKGWQTSVKDCGSNHYMLRIDGRNLIGIHLDVVLTKQDPTDTKKEDLEIWYKVTSDDGSQWQVNFNRNVETGDNPPSSQSSGWGFGFITGLLGLSSGNARDDPGCCFNVQLNGYERQSSRPKDYLGSHGRLEESTSLKLTFNSDKEKTKTLYEASPKAKKAGHRDDRGERVGTFNRKTMQDKDCKEVDNYGGRAFLEQSSSP